MATLVKSYIDSAFARSTFNDEKIATQGEMIGVINRRINQLYSIAARVNPYYFGKLLPVAHDATAGGWPRPEDAEMVVELTNAADGTEIHVIPFNDKRGEMPPRVYEFGQVYMSVGDDGDPLAASTINFRYSRRHPTLNPMVPADHPTNVIESAWPEQFDDLLVLHLSKYLAQKDQRAGEIPAYQAEEVALMETFIRHLEHENYAMKSRFRSKPPVRAGETGATQGT